MEWWHNASFVCMMVTGHQTGATFNGIQKRPNASHTRPCGRVPLCCTSGVRQIQVLEPLLGRLVDGILISPAPC